jgi:CheY-like chemotaxis protein
VNRSVDVKILLVEDDRPKIARILALLTEVGVSRNNVTVAQTGTDARKHLAEAIFDLMILDVAIPYTPRICPTGVAALNC